MAHAVIIAQWSGFAWCPVFYPAHNVCEQFFVQKGQRATIVTWLAWPGWCGLSRLLLVIWLLRPPWFWDELSMYLWVYIGTDILASLPTRSTYHFAMRRLGLFPRILLLWPVPILLHLQVMLWLLWTTVMSSDQKQRLELNYIVLNFTQKGPIKQRHCMSIAAYSCGLMF